MILLVFMLLTAGSTTVIPACEGTGVNLLNFLKIIICRITIIIEK